MVIILYWNLKDEYGLYGNESTTFMGHLHLLMMVLAIGPYNMDKYFFFKNILLHVVIISLMYTYNIIMFS